MIWSEARFRRWPGRKPLILGHRGVGPIPGEAPLVPENTLAAFEEAARQGAEAIELDVRTCASGDVIVLHDPDLARATGGADTRAAASLPYGEIRRVSVSGERIPLLSDALTFARGRGLAVNVELKRDVPDRVELARATARLLRAWDPAHAVLVSSFDPWMLAALRALAPRVPRALLLDRTRHYEVAVRLAPALGVSALNLHRTIAAPDRIEALRRRGTAVHVWTVNDPREALDLTALGVDGLITDVPRVIREALDQGRPS